MDRSLLANATSSEDSPTPGYMLNEIARSTLSNYQANVQLQEFLLARLAKNNHNIKFKVLVIIKHVCRSGRPEFKKEMGRNVEPIKECLQYKGVPDPLRGDQIYQRVREAAREALDAIFDSQMPVTTSAVAAANRIQGMGNDYIPEETAKTAPQSGGFLNGVVSSIQTSIYGDGTDASYAGHPGAQSSFDQNGNNVNSSYPSNSMPGSGSYNSPTSDSNAMHGGYASNGMAGIGNPNFKDPRDEKSWYQKASEVAKASPTLNVISSTISKSIQTVSGGGEKVGLNDGGMNPPVSPYTTNRGPNAFGNNNIYDPNNRNVPWKRSGDESDGMTPSIPQTNKIVPEIGTGQPGFRAGSATADGRYEKSMIDALCEPGGLKATPPEDKLQQFIITSPTLSEEMVGSCLLDLLNSDAWQTRTKALIVIASLVSSKDGSLHKEWWLKQIDEIKSLLNDSKAGVRTQAAKTLKAIGAAVDESLLAPVGAPPKRNIVKQASTTNAIFFGDLAETSTSNNAMSLLDMDIHEPLPDSKPSLMHPPLDNLDYSGGSSTKSPFSHSTTSPSKHFSDSSSQSALFDGMSVGAETMTTISKEQHNPVSTSFNFLDEVSEPNPPHPPQSGFNFVTENQSNVTTTHPNKSSDVSDPFGLLSLSGSTPNPTPPTGMNNVMNAFPPAPMPPPMTPPMQGMQPGFNLNPGMVPMYHSTGPHGAPNGGLRLTVPVGPPAPRGYPNQYMNVQHQSGGAPPYMSTGYPQPVRNNQPFIPATAMIHPMTQRKEIPSADGVGLRTGFSFMDSNNPGKKPTNDSFSFVTDEMKSYNKK